VWKTSVPSDIHTSEHCIELAQIVLGIFQWIEAGVVLEVQKRTIFQGGD
jgi:hypothetical protein